MTTTLVAFFLGTAVGGGLIFWAALHVVHQVRQRAAWWKSAYIEELRKTTRGKSWDGQDHYHWTIEELTR